MLIAEELGAAEAQARLADIAEEANKAAARVVSVAPAMSTSQAHNLRGAFGLRNDPAAAERTAREVTDRRRRAEVAGQGHEGRAVDIPDQVKPVFVDRPRPVTVEYDAVGNRLPKTQAEQKLASVYMAITELFIGADRRPITLATAELATMTGLAQDEVTAAIVELEKRRLLTRQPGRAFSTPLWAVAAI